MDFEALNRLRVAVRTLGSLHVPSLLAYYDPKVHGFSHLTPTGTGELTRFSVASSATCMVSLLVAGRWGEFERAVKGSNGASASGGSASELTAFLDNVLQREPAELTSAGLKPGNAFTLAFTLEAVKIASRERALWKPALPDQYAGKISEWIRKASDLLIGNLLSTRESEPKAANTWAESGSAHLHGLRPTTFLTQLVIRALRTPPARELGDHLSTAVTHWGWLQLLEEFALLTTGRRGADPLALAYAIILFATCKQSSKLSLDETRIIEKTLSAFFSAQLEDGGWQRSSPLHFYPEVGNAYCFDYEVLTQLLQCQGLKEHTLQYVENLEKAFQYVASSSLPVGESGKSWSSGHHPHLPEAESWSTASVYHFAHALDRLVAEAIRVEVFKYLSAPYSAPRDAALSNVEGARLFKERFVDSSIRLDNATESLSKAILERFLQPLAAERNNVANGKGFSKTTAISGILFGPPGTSKTQLANLVATYLGWPLLPIDPSHLVREGLDSLQAESNHVFAMLAALEQTVVFLDEFDELMRERTSVRAGMTSRFLTTAMLPKLTSISESRRVVFLLATNHVSQFDFAIRRPGRFDIVAQVMPPTWVAKQGHAKWSEASARIKLFLDTTTSTPVVGKGKETLAWPDLLERFTFQEFDSIAKRTRSEMTDAELQSLLEGAWEKATLNQEFQDGTKRSSWQEQCATDERLNRFL